LNVILTASVDGFMASLQKAQAATSTFVSAIQAIGGGIGGVFASMVSAAQSAGTSIVSALVNDLAIGAAVTLFQTLERAAESAFNTVVEATEKAFESTTQLLHLSDRLGISTEALAGFEAQARSTGLGLDEFTASITKFQKNLAEAAHGTGKAQGAFNALGLDATELAKLPLDDAFGKFADAFSKVQNPAEQARLAMEAFGKSGYQLINILKQGSAGAAEFKTFAADIGLGISPEQAAIVEDANQAFLQLKETVEGLGRTLAVALAPLAGDLADKIQGFVAQFTGKVQQWGPVFAQFRDTVLAVWDAVLEAGTEAFNGINEVAQEVFGVDLIDQANDLQTTVQNLFLRLEYDARHWQEVLRVMVLQSEEWFLGLLQTVLEFAQKVQDFFGKDLLKNVITAFKYVGQALYQWAKDTYENIKSGLTGGKMKPLEIGGIFKLGGIGGIEVEYDKLAKMVEGKRTQIGAELAKQQAGLNAGFNQFVAQKQAQLNNVHKAVQKSARDANALLDTVQKQLVAPVALAGSEEAQAVIAGVANDRLMDVTNSQLDVQKELLRTAVESLKQLQKLGGEPAGF
jgi:hypothetical protein